MEFSAYQVGYGSLYLLTDCQDSHQVNVLYDRYSSLPFLPIMSGTKASSDTRMNRSIPGTEGYTPINHRPLNSGAVFIYNINRSINSSGANSLPHPIIRNSPEEDTKQQEAEGNEQVP